MDIIPLCSRLETYILYLCAICFKVSYCNTISSVFVVVILLNISVDRPGKLIRYRYTRTKYKVTPLNSKSNLEKS